MASDSGSGGSGGGAADDIQRQFNDAVAKLTGPGEPLIVLGAILLVVVQDILGEIILDKVSTSYFMLLPAWFVLAAVILFRFRNASLPVSYPLALALLGFAAGFVGVRDIIWDLQNNFFDRDTSYIVFGLIGWAGSILMLLGAIQIWPTVNKT